MNVIDIFDNPDYRFFTDPTTIRISNFLKDCPIEKFNELMAIVDLETRKIDLENEIDQIEEDVNEEKDKLEKELKKSKILEGKYAKILEDFEYIRDEALRLRTLNTKDITALRLFLQSKDEDFVEEGEFEFKFTNDNLIENVRKSPAIKNLLIKSVESLKEFKKLSVIKEEKEDGSDWEFDIESVDLLFHNNKSLLDEVVKDDNFKKIIEDNEVKKSLEIVKEKAGKNFLKRMFGACLGNQKKEKEIKLNMGRRGSLPDTQFYMNNFTMPSNNLVFRRIPRQRTPEFRTKARQRTPEFRK